MTIFDGMILIVVIGVGLVFAESVVAQVANAVDHPVWLLRLSTSLLLPVTVGVLALRLRRPRPSWRRIICQPGAAASLSVAAISAVDLASCAILLPQIDLRRATGLASFYWLACSGHLGLAVAAAWGALALTRRWRPEPGWIDLLGRLLGGLWLTALACDWWLGRWPANSLWRTLLSRVK